MQAYVFDVEDEYAESDIPTTLIRSKADCPGIEVSLIATVGLVIINKLLLFFKYLQRKQVSIHNLKTPH